MSKPAEIVNKVNAYVLGLDVHKQVIAWCLLDRRGRRAGQGEIESTSEALADLVRREIGRKRAHVAFEASTCSIWVFDLLVELFRGGDRVHVAHAKKIRAIANSTRKNDAHDAWWLAYLTYEGRLPEVHLPTGLYRQLRTISRHRVFCVQRRTQLAQVIHAHFRQAGLALPAHTLARARSLDPLRKHALKLPGYLQPIVVELVEELASAKAQIDRWEEALAKVASHLEEVAELRRWIPGVGDVLAATIVGEIGDISRFKHPRRSAPMPAWCPVSARAVAIPATVPSPRRAARSFAGHWSRRPWGRFVSNEARGDVSGTGFAPSSEGSEARRRGTSPAPGSWRRRSGASSRSERCLTSSDPSGPRPRPRTRSQDE